MPEILRYRGEQTNFDPDHVLGPDLDGRRLTIKSMTYDPDTDASTAVLKPVLPGEFAERLMPIIINQQSRKRLSMLFR